MSHHADVDELLLKPEDAARKLRVSRTTLYALLRDGDLRSVRIGRCRRIPTAELIAYVERLLGESLD